jgi:tRNA pseudouridine13 synthase
MLGQRAGGRHLTQARDALLYAAPRRLYPGPMPRPPGRIKTTPEDFRVDEIPAYEPSGEGPHLFVHFEKRLLTTDEAVKAIARALGVDLREVGVAGMKDKHAVTTQWISMLAPPKDASFDQRARDLAIDGVRILEAKRHGNKLKTGHLHGNRFQLVVRGIPRDAYAGVVRALETIGVEGVPNAFGQQRFGVQGDTAERARAWLTGNARAPADPRKRRFEFSALQSAIFNAVLDARVADGTWNVPIAGDLLKKEETGGLFLCTDVQVDRERALRGELGPTGPLYGDRMRHPEGEAAALEERIAGPMLEGIDLKRARSLGEGTRRALRLRVDGLSVAQVMEDEGEAGREQACSCRVGFVLPKGSYATTVLASAVEVIDSARENARGEHGVEGSSRTTEEE